MAGLRSQAQQRAELRSLVGHGADTAIVKDLLLDSCLDSACRQLNLDNPIPALSSFPTVVGQQIYTLVLPSDAIRISRAYYAVNEDGSCCWGQQREILGLTVPLTRELTPEGRYTIEEPGLIAALRRARSTLDEASGSVRVDPPATLTLPAAPTRVVTVPYLLCMRRYATPADMGELHYESFMAFARHRLHQALAGGAGGTTSVKSEQGISMTTRASQAHEAFAQKNFDEYMARRKPFIPFLAPR